MIYTTIQKQSIIRVLYDVMMADGHKDFQEIQYLNHVKTLLGISLSTSGLAIDQEVAIQEISRMTDEQKMEVAAMLQQMIIADGIQHNNEIYFFGKVIKATGIDKCIERKTHSMNINYDDAKIYLMSSKVALSRRSAEYLSMIDEQASNFREIFNASYVTFDGKIDLILEYTRDCVKGSGWDLSDVDGVSWFIANFTDAMVKSGAIDNYDDMFIACFNKYFQSGND